MKSILLKIDDELYAGLESSAKEMNTSKTGFIKNAIDASIKAYKRSKLEAQLKKEIEEINKHNLDKELIDDFEIVSLIDLKIHLDNEN